MSSSAKQNSNRRNALKSTGPKTSSGKKKSSQNARRHGLSQPIDPGQVGDALDQLQAVLIKAGYQPSHAFRIGLCLLDYERVKRAESELDHRMQCLVSACFLMDPNAPNHLAPLPLDNAEDREIGLAGWVAHKMKAGHHINKLPAGGLRGEAFWNKVYSTTHFERYRKRSLNQLLKALKEQNNDYRV